MSDFDELDSLFGPLREPATPAELASEREMIELMVKTHRHAKGTIMFSSRRARVATFIAAGVIGFGGVAAAGGGGLDLSDLDETPVVNPEVEVEEIEEIEAAEITTTTAAPEVEDSDDDTFTDEIAKIAPAVVADATDVEPDDPNTDFDENDCLLGNHGKTVSAVAHGDDLDDDDDTELDDAEVRDAAHSMCGKTDDDADKVDDDDSELDDEVEVEDEVEDADEDSDEDDSDEDDDDEDHGSGNRPEESSRGESQGDRGNGKSGDDD